MFSSHIFSFIIHDYTDLLDRKNSWENESSLVHPPVFSSHSYMDVSTEIYHFF